MQNLTVKKFEISFGETLFDGISSLDESFVDHTYQFKFIDEEMKFLANKQYKLLIEYKGLINTVESGIFTGIDRDVKQKYNFKIDSIMSLKKRFNDEIFLEIKDNT